MEEGTYVVVDGPDGAGKGTQILLLQEYYKNKGIPVVFTREPGGTPRAEEIRALLLSSGFGGIDPFAQLLLFFAARQEHVEKLVRPKVAEGELVISDRADPSTYAYQIFGHDRQDLFPDFRRLRERVYHGLTPHYIFLFVPTDIAMERLARRKGQDLTHFDQADRAWKERVREGYIRFAKVFGPSVIIDGNRDPIYVHADVLKWVEAARDGSFRAKAERLNHGPHLRSQGGDLLFD